MSVGYRSRVLIMILAAALGVFRAFIFEDPSLATSVVLWVLFMTMAFGLLLIPPMVLIMMEVARMIWKSDELLRPSWRTDFLKRFCAGDPLHVIHVVGWAAIVYTLVLLGAHYLLYQSVAVLAVFQLPAGFGVLLGVWLSVLVLKKHYAVVPTENSIRP